MTVDQPAREIASYWRQPISTEPPMWTFESSSLGSPMSTRGGASKRPTGRVATIGTAGGLATRGNRCGSDCGCGPVASGVTDVGEAPAVGNIGKLAGSGLLATSTVDDGDASDAVAFVTGSRDGTAG
jgi:hypothetical protein